MNLHELAALEALRKQLHNLEDTIGDLHRLTRSAPSDPAWDQVRDAVSCLDSIADVMRQAMDSRAGPL
jgi:hypothetical protein